ncbi:MAG: hypothetical protein WBX02_20110 [Terriglobales bacterium]
MGPNSVTQQSWRQAHFRISLRTLQEEREGWRTRDFGGARFWRWQLLLFASFGARGYGGGLGVMTDVSA